MNNPNQLCRYITIILLTVLTACSSVSVNDDISDTAVKTQKKSSKTNLKFREFLKKFELLRLPLTIKIDEINLDPTKQLTEKDNVFIKYQDPGAIYAYGILPDTTDNFKIIWLQPADDYIPIITTFTKDGKKIDSKYIGVGGCGVDCCFECSEVIVINKDLTTFSADSIKSCECDSNGPDENTTRRYIRYQMGKILKTGKINISKVLEKSVE